MNNSRYGDNRWQRWGSHSSDSWKRFSHHSWDTPEESVKATKYFEKGMVLLMQGEMAKAGRNFRQCLSYDSNHTPALNHLEVVKFYAKSQRVADATIKFLYKSGKAHKFDASGVEMQEFDAKDVEETHAEMKRLKHDPKHPAVAFGMGRAYLALATEEKPGWNGCAKNEFDRCLSLFRDSKAEKYMKAMVHRIYAQVADKEFHLGEMHRLDAHIPD